MAASAGSIAVDITARTLKLEQALGTANHSIDRFGRGAVKVGGMIAGVFSVGAIANFARQAIDLGDNMATLAERMQTSVENLSRLQYVAEQSNTSFDALRLAMDQLAKGLSKAEDGGGRARKSLADLRVDVDALTRLPIERQLNVLADAFQAIATPADQTRIAMELFGAAGADMIPILRQGSAGIRALGDEAERAGAILGTKTAQDLARMDAANKKVAASTRVFAAELTALVATPVSSFLGGLTVSMRLLRDTINDVKASTRDAFGLKAAGTPMEELQRDLAKINKAIDAAVPFQDTSGLEAAREQLKALIYQYDAVAQYQDRANEKFEELDELAKAKKIPLLDEILVTAGARAEAAQKAIERERELRAEAQKSFRDAVSAQQVWADLEDRYGRPVDGMDWEDFASDNARGIEDALEQSGRKFDDWIETESERLSETITGKTTEMTIFAEEAARNMQGAFADFLFDPFDKGVKGLLRGFVDVLRRMVAEAASAKILGALFGKSTGIGGFLGKALGGLFGGARAEGGPVSTGRSYLVGERGPELFVPRSSGGIVPTEALSAGGGVVVAPTYNISGLGLSYEQVNLLLRQSNEQMVRALTDRRVRR